MIAFLDPEPAVAVLVGEGVAPLWQYLHDSPTQKLRRPGSLLRWMIELIRIRKECPAIGAGEWRILPTRSRHVLAVLYTRRDSTVLCLHNFDETPREITLDLKMPSGASYCAACSAAARVTVQPGGTGCVSSRLATTGTA
jgi:hypothetical protein